MKKGLVLMIVLIVFGVLLIGAVGAGIYFYNFYVFKTVRICVGDGIDSGLPCDVTSECVDFVMDREMSIDLDGAPVFMQEKFQEIIDDVIYCDETCFLKNVRGVNFENAELEMLKGCHDDEIEFVVEIRGKEGLEIIKWMRG